MIKKIVSVILALVLMAGLAACSSTTDTTDESEETASEATGETADESATDEESAETTEYTGEEMTLTFSTQYAEVSTEGEGIALFADLVSEKTDGKVTIEAYYSSTLVAQDQQIAGLSKGTLDMTSFGLDGLYTWWDMQNSCYFFKNTAHRQAFEQSEIHEELYETAAEEYNVRYLATLYNGLRTVNLNIDRKVTCRADLADIKLRMPNTEACLFWGTSLGANPTPMSSADIYLGIQTGAVDGQDNAVNAIRTNSFYEVTESVTITGHIISACDITMRDDLFQSMSPELQQIILESAQEAGAWITDTIDAQYEEDVAFLEENGVTVYTLTDEELTAYSEEVKAYYFESEEGQALTADWDMDLYNEIQALAE